VERADDDRHQQPEDTGGDHGLGGGDEHAPVALLGKVQRGADRDRAEGEVGGAGPEREAGPDGEKAQAGGEHEQLVELRATDGAGVLAVEQEAHRGDRHEKQDLPDHMHGGAVAAGIAVRRVVEDVVQLGLRDGAALGQLHRVGLAELVGHRKAASLVGRGGAEAGI
jgi:hypothetical protein